MLTFKKLKFNDEYSEETDAYTADVYWNGVFIGRAENTGKGGMTNLDNWNEAKRGPAYVKALKEATEFAKTQSSAADPELGNFAYLEDYLDYAVVEAYNFAQAKRWVAKKLKSAVYALTKEARPRLVKLDVPARRTVLQAAEMVKKVRDDVAEVLNLLPIDEATKRWLEIEAATKKP